MKKTNIFGTGNKRKINPKWFTGKVWMKELSNTIISKEQDIYHVHFLDGARTKLHFHNGSQILIGVEGFGSLVIFEKKADTVKKLQTIKLSKGDIAYIPAKTFHIHGSISSEEFSHIAINILPSRSEYKTEWFELDKSRYRRI